MFAVSNMLSFCYRSAMNTFVHCLLLFFVQICVAPVYKRKLSVSLSLMEVSASSVVIEHTCGNLYVDMSL